MRLVRSSALWVAIAAAMLGASALLSGCANDSQSDAAADIDHQEQALLQERIQKGIAKSPIKPGKVRRKDAP